MSQVFSFKRYVWLVKRQWCENAAIYKWGIVLLVLVVGLLFWLTSNWKDVDNPHFGQMETFSITGLFFIYIYGAYFFESLSSRHKRMFYFSLPVSPLDRVAVAFTYVMILMPVLILTIFTVFDFAAVQLFNHIHETLEQMFFKTSSPFGNIGMMVVMLFSYLSFTSIFTFGSLIFGKKGIVITLIASCILLFISSFILIKILSIPPWNVSDIIKGNILNFFFLLPVWWVLMFFVMKKKEA